MEGVLACHKTRDFLTSFAVGTKRRERAREYRHRERERERESVEIKERCLY